ncbi:UrcA family protein [Acidomonas methanolica]|uniref:UrcA family protein n=1 Tax=Acidomonas methanolica TaxID=437 RepID=UPI00211A4262|nr:UrcA family protein [Acidomonas methanolica]MCQ9156392.1 UrcA family protein [Acidomonas methanolica]
MSQSVSDIPCPKAHTHATRHIREWTGALCIAGAILGGLVMLMAMQGPALAQDADERVERISVPYVAADLSDPVRVRQLLTRIDKAALKACGDMEGLSIPTQDVIEWSNCHHESFARGVAAVHSPTLTRMADALDPWIGPTAHGP